MVQPIRPLASFPLPVRPRCPRQSRTRRNQAPRLPAHCVCEDPQTSRLELFRREENRRIGERANRRGHVLPFRRFAVFPPNISFPHPVFSPPPAPRHRIRLGTGPIRRAHVSTPITSHTPIA